MPVTATGELGGKYGERGFKDGYLVGDEVKGFLFSETSEYINIRIHIYSVSWSQTMVQRERYINREDVINIPHTHLVSVSAYRLQP